MTMNARQSTSRQRVDFRRQTCVYKYKMLRIPRVEVVKKNGNKRHFTYNQNEIVNIFGIRKKGLKNFTRKRDNGSKDIREKLQDAYITRLCKWVPEQVVGVKVLWRTMITHGLKRHDPWQRKVVTSHDCPFPGGTCHWRKYLGRKVFMKSKMWIFSPNNSQWNNRSRLRKHSR